MKKILLLGGSAQQVIAIQTAKRMGFYTVLCDYLTDNPGQYVADKFYLISTTDMNAVLKIAEQEKIDGILAYASDPAAPTAAYVAEKMNLPGIPYEAADILCHKDKFRKFLDDNDFNSPKSEGYSTLKEAVEGSRKFNLPLMVKPVDSSGSKGTIIVRNYDEVEGAVQEAISYSRCDRVIIEQYIEKKHPYLIGGDIFVYNGKVVQWGLMNCHRDNQVNPLVPVGKSYPLLLDEDDLQRTKETLQKMIDLLHIQAGELNVELIVDKNNKVWPIDIGPRSGGNMIPDLLGYIFSTDEVEMSVKVAMGMPIEQINSAPVPYYATYNLHAKRDGIFQGVHYSDTIKKYVIKECVYKNYGDKVEYFDNASKAIGIVFMKFDDKDTMLDMLENIQNHIFVNVDPEKISGGG